MVAPDEPQSPSSPSPPRKLSITTKIVLSLVLVVCLLLPSTVYNRQMRYYLASASTISYNSELGGPQATVPVSPNTEDDRQELSSSTDEEEARYGRFLSLTDPSTQKMRKWLNQSLVEGDGWIAYSHETSSLSQQGRRNTVTYKSCCGLGHRLTRLEQAAHVALLYEATLNVIWSDCGPDTFQRLFGTEPFLLGQSETTLDGHGANDTTIYHWTFSNDLPHCYGVNGVHRKPDFCADIFHGKDQAGPKLYQDLLDLYIRRHVVQNFTQTHFAGKISIGMHIRAGNNETGDFTRKNRQIQNMDDFVKLNAKRVRDMLPPSPAILFIATDTPSYVEAFRKELNGTMPVVELEQIRAKEGTGVLFGEHGAPKPQGDECLEGWHAALQDMMILASTDVVFASTYSSFTRTMPRVMALSRQNRPIPESYCENWKQFFGTQRMVCYHSFDNFNANPPPKRR